MTKKKKITIITTSVAIPVILLPTTTLAGLAISDNNTLTKYYNDKLDGETYLNCSKLIDDLYFRSKKMNKFNQELSKYLSSSWYQNVNKESVNQNTGEVWDFTYDKVTGIPVNAYCNSQAQALALYVCGWGDFWNEALHQGKEPNDKTYKFPWDSSFFPNQEIPIRGSDYKYVSQSLQSAELLLNMVVYHGVEYMEDEFYTQLENNIKYDPNKKTYDYSNCVGQIITTNGWLSTTTEQNIAENYCDGFVWNKPNNEFHLPLKEKFVFKIYVPKNIPGISYISWLKFVHWTNMENQVLIDKNTSFEIKKYYKKGDINYFDLKFLGYKQGI